MLLFSLPMLMSASSEFVALCRAQVALLTQGLGATLSIVYCTDEAGEQSQGDLVPVVAYPEGAVAWDSEQVFSLLSANLQGFSQESRSLNANVFLTGSSFPALPTSALPAAAKASEKPTETASGSPVDSSNSSADPSANQSVDQSLLYAQRVLLPMVHDGVMVGLLVTARADRPWMDGERSQIERIARSLAIACVLDQRSQWAEHDLHELQQLQDDQRVLFDNLLHQFRNPLTALKTFGKLLMKRLPQSDPNAEVASAIVRESEHLQDLAERFEQVVDSRTAPRLLQASDEADIHTPGLLPPALSVPLLPSANSLAPTPLTVQWCYLDEAIAPLLESARAIAHDRSLNFNVELVPELPPVWADPVALREVLNNLLDNALKYTPASGTVMLRSGLHRSVFSEQRQHSMEQQGIAVIDDGPGIPLADAARLFERNFRGIQAESEIPGTGLGLAIARQLVTQMEGGIQMFSPAHTSGLVKESVKETGAAPGTAFVLWLKQAAD